MVGKARVLYGKDVVATVDLVAAESINGSIILRIVGWFKSLLKSTPVKIVFILVLLIILAYIALIIRKNMIKAKRRKPRIVK